MALGIEIEGTKLHEVKMRMPTTQTGVVRSLSYPKTQMTFSIDGETLRVRLPAYLALELYRTSVIPQKASIPVEVKIGGKSKGRYLIQEVLYLDDRRSIDFVLLRLPARRAKKSAERNENTQHLPTTTRRK